MGRWLTRSYVVDSDGPALPALRELDRKHSLVFLPNHRSYLDPLVLRSALGSHGFSPNYVLGGINLALWPLSELGRRAGPDLHPPVDPRRPGLPGDAASLPRLPAAPTREPGVVLRGRPDPHRQAPPAQDGRAQVAGRRVPGQRGLRRRRAAGAGRDRLRPAARGLRAVARGGRRQEDPREPDLGGALRPRPVAPARPRARALRPHALPARRPRGGDHPGRLGRGLRGGPAGRVRGRAPDQRGHPDHAVGAGDLRAARQRRPGDDAAGDAGRPRPAADLRAQAPAAAHLRRRPRPARGPEPGAAHPGPRGRGRGVRRRPRARLRDRPGPRPRGRLLPQHRDPLLHHPGDRGGRGRADLRGRRRGRHLGHLGARPRPARPAEVRVLLRHQARVRRGAARRGRPGQPAVARRRPHPRRAGDRGPRVRPADRAPRRRAVPGVLPGGGRPAGDPRARRPGRRGGAGAGEPRGGPAALAPARPAQPRVDLQGPDDRRDQAGRQPRPARPGRRGAAHRPRGRSPPSWAPPSAPSRWSAGSPSPARGPRHERRPRDRRPARRGRGRAAGTGDRGLLRLRRHPHRRLLRRDRLPGAADRR